MSRVDQGIVVQKGKLPVAEDIVAASYIVCLEERLATSPNRWLDVVTEVLSRPTPLEWISEREGPKQLVLSYVEGAYAKAARMALARLGIISDFEILQTAESNEDVGCLGKLTFKFNGQTAVSMQWGECQRVSGVSVGNTRKGAATDALKKCMSEFGWARDVYMISPRKPPKAPDPADLKRENIEKLYAIGSRGGMTRDEVNAFVGGDPEKLNVVDMASWKRKLEKRVNGN